MESNVEQSVEPLDLVWGAKSIGHVIQRPARQTFHLLETGQLPARKSGGRWCASRETLRRHFSVSLNEPEAA